jgi:hypothetical protein
MQISFGFSKILIKIKKIFLARMSLLALLVRCKGGKDYDFVCVETCASSTSAADVVHSYLISNIYY